MTFGGNYTIEEDYNLFLTIIKKINSLFYRPISKTSYADSIEWDVSAFEIKKGENLIISGRTTPQKSIRMDANFEIPINVKDQKYEHRFDDVAITSLPNEFRVEANNVKDMTFTVRMLIPFRQHRKAENGKAIYVDNDVPSGNYDIVINGEADDDAGTVILKIKASQTIVSDSKGNFVYEYPTKPFPPGIVSLSLGKEKKEIKIIP
ncbi:hypothetical protein [Methanococcoides sp. AM1]|uniref:hypothetical protein n=1 Tax=Methanococcoides sp. AM1 TaxID=1201011 RepID=UPI001082641E|nr:hypothetical protein [Methanococcoides sp. AM1]